MEERYHHLQKRRVKKKRRRRLFIYLIFMSLIGSVGLYMFNSYSSLMEMYSGFTRDKSKLRAVDVEITKEPFSVLIMGIEDYATDGQNGRTDSLMFATINPKTKNVSLMSIPRDSRVTIAGKNKKDKINAAHAYGGEKMALDTVENFLRVPVDHYVKIDFKGFKGIVDAVGGITVDVPFNFEERSDIDYYKLIQFKQGQQELNGEEALAYVRMRKQDPNGDYGRAARQRQVLAAVVHKLNSASTVFKIKDLAEVVGKYVKTDIPVSDGLALYNKLSGFDPSNIKTIKLEGEDKKLNDIYYFIPDEMSVQNVRNEILKNLGQDKTDTNSTTNTSSNSDTNSTNSSTKKKEQESPSTNANAEWLMRNHQ
ncbi:LytR family transcriptional regulator [Bacillus pseudomycoides]|uniref:LytR family transcriptional regulator n=1 Tax=Bacillus pseudomycoides TaxID=64104 RepID=A0A2A8B7C2_9BACI|nr:MULTISPECIES: LCP family protein [Bacillus]AIK37604.1 putative transcriptional regulator yvhJ [Bacillus pseudomycoides]AJI17645.1 putative transcriptional regulator yvhJ [Bacillus pseudomycoides]EEM14506.1 Transcriptional regulator, LytR [Bacillus pseudomycoides DSM 12442]KFN15997.1 putative transcriptional regulator yvhJ [Bacillus pseudomycoides]MCR8858360.1 LCP family protein [Bacillus pseudomycoides]